MRILASFDDDNRNRKVNYKAQRVLMKQTVEFDSGETESIALYRSDSNPQSRTLFIESNLIMDAETFSTTAVLKTEGDVTVNTIQLIPGQACVIPLDDTVGKIDITSNSSATGQVKIVVSENV